MSSTPEVLRVFAVSKTILPESSENNSIIKRAVDLLGFRNPTRHGLLT
jgi:hypothetical protein